MSHDLDTVQQDPSLFGLPAPLLEHILRLTAPHPSSADLTGLYRSSHAGRQAVSSHITAATIWLDGQQERHGQTCGMPQLACTRSLELHLEKVPDAAAMLRLCSDLRVQGFLAAVQRLEVHSERPSDIDLPAVAATLPSLSTLTLHVRDSAGLQLSALSALSGLHSLNIEQWNWNSYLGEAELSQLPALTSLTSLALGVSLATAAHSAFPELAQLHNLAHLSVKYPEYSPALSTREVADKPLSIQQLSLLSALSALTRLEVKDSYSEGSPDDLPLTQYIRPISLCPQLVWLELPYLHLASAHSLRQLLDAMPQLTRLRIYTIDGFIHDMPHDPTLAAPPIGSSLRHLALGEFDGNPSALLSLPIPSVAAIEVTDAMRLFLGPASSPAAVAAAAEQLGRVANALQAPPDLHLSWAAVPLCPAASVIAALQPVGRCLTELRLQAWLFNEELVAQVAQVAPLLTHVELIGTTITDTAWGALMALRKLKHFIVGSSCVGWEEGLVGYAAAVRTLRGVSVIAHDAAAKNAAREMEGSVQALRQARGLEKLHWRVH